MEVNSDLRQRSLNPRRSSGGGACCCDGRDAGPDGELSPAAPPAASCKDTTSEVRGGCRWAEPKAFRVRKVANSALFNNFLRLC